MNVAVDPWIPVVTNEGNPGMASLCAVLTEGEKFIDLAVRPHERVALMRLFLCVTHAALDGPKNYDEWRNVPEKLPAAAHKYLDTWKDSFELFHTDKPWLQVKDLIRTDGSGKTSPVALLDFELATGNNSTLSDHNGCNVVRMVEPARLVLNLLTFQNFSSGGGAPVAQWKGKKTSQVGNPDAPCLSQSMAHCLLRGGNLADTIYLNLPAYDLIARVYREYSYNKETKTDKYSEVKIGKPVWECFPASPDDTSNIKNATQTYIGRLTPVSRWIRLSENTDQMYCCNGFRYLTYKDSFPAEPTAAVRLINRKDKKGTENSERKVVSINPGKATWRELSALLTNRAANGLGGPLAMNNVPYDTGYDFQVCALIRDQASMDTAVESVFHISPTFQPNIAAYSTEVELAEKTSLLLRGAVEVYRNIIDKDWNSRVKRTPAKEQKTMKNRLAQTALLSYWTTVEKNLPLLTAHIEAIGTDDAIPTRKRWRRMFSDTALESYRITCGCGTPRQMHAFAVGWQKLITRRDEPESNTNEIKEE
jgi:CRISPR system Cascade subunit CasA